jgi:hypothetical protein
MICVRGTLHILLLRVPGKFSNRRTVDSINDANKTSWASRFRIGLLDRHAFPLRGAQCTSVPL